MGTNLLRLTCEEAAAIIRVCPTVDLSGKLLLARPDRQAITVRLLNSVLTGVLPPKLLCVATSTDSAT